MSRDLIEEFRGLLPDTVLFSLKKDLMISEDIDSEVDEAAAQFGYFAILSEKAETRYQRLKTQFEIWESEVKMAKDEENIAGKEKKFTESQMRSYIFSQPKYSAYRKKLMEWENSKRILKQIARAFEKKAELIQTKSSNRRAEVAKAK